MKKSKRAKITKQMQHNPDNVTATLTNESPAIREAREQEAKATEAAQQTRSAADAAQQAVEQASQAVMNKQAERDRVKAQCEELKERVSHMALDDPQFQKTSAEGWGIEQVLTRLEGECGGLKESLTVAEKRAEDAVKAAEVASAGLRNAQRQVTLKRLTEAFPVQVDKLLDLIRGRNQVLSEADEDSRTHDLPRLGRFRLLPREDQLRRHESYELGTILTRHQVGLAMTPAAPFSAFSLDSGEGVSEAEIPNSEEEWAVLTATALEGGSDE